MLLAALPLGASAQTDGSASTVAESTDEVVVFDDEAGDAPPPSAAPPPSTWQVRASVKGEVGALGLVDTRYDGEREDAYEARLRAALESEVQTSEHVRFVLGSRLNYFWGAPAYTDLGERGFGDSQRFELDAELMAAYVAYEAGSLLHLQIGQQVVATGRLDLLTALDPLGVYDARASVSLDPASMRLPQPAARLVLDAGGAMSFEAIVVPWFRAHRLRLGRDRHDTRVLLGEKAADALDPETSNENASRGPVARELALELQGPSPSLAYPQAFARLGFRPPKVDFGFSAATALEKVPLIYPTPELERYLLDPDDVTVSDALVARIQEGRKAADVRYPRYYLLAFDIGGAFGSSALALEFVYCPSRQLYTAPLERGGVPRPNLDGPIGDPSSRARGVETAQAGAHFDHTFGETLVVIVEGTYFRALHLPNDEERYWSGLDPERGDFAMVLTGARWLLLNGTFTVGGSLVAATGPSGFVQPQVEYRPFDGLVFTIGGAWAVGPEPEIQAAGGTASLAIGGLLQRDDNLYFGTRWLW